MELKAQPTFTYRCDRGHGIVVSSVPMSDCYVCTMIRSEEEIRDRRLAKMIAEELAVKLRPLEKKEEGFCEEGFCCVKHGLFSIGRPGNPKECPECREEKEGG